VSQSGTAPAGTAPAEAGQAHGGCRGDVPGAGPGAPGAAIVGPYGLGTNALWTMVG
jgi:hypothetical protein